MFFNNVATLLPLACALFMFLILVFRGFHL
jgi:hypothetical protein